MMLRTILVYESTCSTPEQSPAKTTLRPVNGKIKVYVVNDYCSHIGVRPRMRFVCGIARMLEML
jgi:hypothetical protein